MNNVGNVGKSRGRLLYQASTCGQQNRGESLDMPPMYLCSMELKVHRCNGYRCHDRGSVSSSRTSHEWSELNIRCKWRNRHCDHEGLSTKLSQCHGSLASTKTAQRNMRKTRSLTGPFQEDKRRNVDDPLALTERWLLGNATRNLAEVDWFCEAGILTNLI